MFFIIFILAYIAIFSFILNYIYNRLSKFYTNLKYKEKETGKEIDLGEKYDAFRPYDPINYADFMILGLIFFPTRAILSLLDCIVYALHLKILKIFYKNLDTDKRESEIRSNVIKFYGKLFLKINFISLIEEKIHYEDIYKKYLGPDYDFTDERYSLLISNHLGFYDVVANMAINGTAFLAMKVISGFPIGGDIARDSGGIFVERASESSRKHTFQALEDRQNDFYNQKIFTKLLVFPEGTTSNNKYIVKFKKGAFHLLLPLKPMIFHIDTKMPFHLCSNVTNLFFHVLRSFTCFKNNIFYSSLPVIRPTQYMFDNYAHLGKEKWQIYCSVVKNMYMEMGNFKSTELGHRDKDAYYEALETGMYNGVTVTTR